jgi:hypothetical protein
MNLQKRTKLLTKTEGKKSLWMFYRTTSPDISEKRISFTSKIVSTFETYSSSSVPLWVIREDGLHTLRSPSRKHFLHRRKINSFRNMKCLKRFSGVIPIFDESDDANNKNLKKEKNTSIFQLFRVPFAKLLADMIRMKHTD